MNDITPALEALLMMASEPIPTTDLASAVDAPVAAAEDALVALADWYEQTGRGFQLRRVAGGWRYYTHPDQHDLIAEWLTADSSSRLSQAALETLAVIAYQQPISRSRVSAVRGVNVDGVVRTLTTRGLIEVGSQDGESGASLLVTTPFFLEKMGMDSLAELPPLAPHLPDAVQLEAELAALVDKESDERD